MDDIRGLLYGNLFDAMEGSDSGVANFARGSLHFATAVTQFGGLVSQGLALAGKQEEALDVLSRLTQFGFHLEILQLFTSNTQFISFYNS